MENLDIELIRKCYSEFKTLRKNIFTDIERYYFGDTDSLKNFKHIKGRSNLQPKFNIFQKLVDEEADYSLGNDLTIKSKIGNDEIIKLIDDNLSNLKQDHNLQLMIEYIKNKIVFEMNYIKNGEFKSKIISPLHGYMYFDEDDEPNMFLYIYQKNFSDDKYKDYIRIYKEDYIYETDDTFANIEILDNVIFKRLQIGVTYEGGIDGRKTMFKVLKTPIDAFETNYADAVCEISDTRNSIMKGKNLKLEKDEKGNPIPPIIRNNTFINIEGDEKSDIEWMTKNSNDNTMTMLDKELNYIYTLSSHIDHNEKMQSNLSGIALRSKLQCLESKCKRNELAIKEIILHRIKCLFDYIYINEGKQYDINDIELIFTPNIPQDLNSLADTLSKIPHEVMSNETKMTMIPGITNIALEKNRINAENKAAMPLVDLNKEVNNEED